MYLKKSLRKVVKAIKAIDELSIHDEIGGKENDERLADARNNLVNILFSNGYEIESPNNYRLIKSEYKRDLV